MTVWSYACVHAQAKYVCQCHQTTSYSVKAPLQYRAIHNFAQPKKMRLSYSCPATPLACSTVTCSCFQPPAAVYRPLNTLRSTQAGTLATG